MAKKKRKPRRRKSSTFVGPRPESKFDVKQRKADEKLKRGQALEGVATITEAFAIGIGALSEADSIRAQGRFQEAQLAANAAELDKASRDAIERGDFAAARRLEDARLQAGSSKARLAASGVDVGTGSAADVIGETVQFGIEDAQQIRTNAFRQAFGFKRQAINTRAQGRQVRIGRKFKERTTMISGGLSAVNALAGGIGQLGQAGAFGKPAAPTGGA